MVKYSAEKPANATDLKFTGVRKRKWGKWVSEIRLPNSRERIWLGSYDSPEKAARAFDAAQFCLRGPSAKFNFPDNPPEIDAGRSLSPPEIQIAAARFANSEPARKESENCSMEEAESPCPSVVSDLTGQIDGGELMLDIPFLDLLTNTGSGCCYPNDFGIFPGFDDFQDVPLMEPTVDFGEEFFDGVLTEDSFLWNF